MGCSLTFCIDIIYFVDNVIVLLYVCCYVYVLFLFCCTFSLSCQGSCYLGSASWVPLSLGPFHSLQCMLSFIIQVSLSHEVHSSPNPYLVLVPVCGCHLAAMRKLWCIWVCAVLESWKVQRLHPCTRLKCLSVHAGDALPVLWTLGHLCHEIVYSQDL